jgi:thioredoxin reductase
MYWLTEAVFSSEELCSVTNAAKRKLILKTSNWKWPSVDGLHDFKGKLMHSAAWDDKYDFKDKTVAVVGTGSSGVQIVATTQPGK